MKRKVGDSVGNYRIEGCIKETRNAYLYKAVLCEDNGDQTKLPYVIKQYKEDMHMDNNKELEITQNIDSNCSDSIVVPILHRKWDEKEKVYAVMQSREQGGKFLSDLIEKLEKDGNRIPISVQLDILEKLLISVKSLHECLKKDEKHEGYLHLDLHPGNIFIESVDVTQTPIRIGAVKFIDFYNALPIRRVDKIAERSDADAIGITAGYSAPEIDITGRKCFSYSADLYSVAAIAARMYTGKNVKDILSNFDKSVQECECICTEIPLVDMLMKKFILCGLEYNSRYRYKTAQDMMSFLSNVKKCEENKHVYYDLFATAYDLCIMPNEIEPFQVETHKYEEAVRKLDQVLHSNNIDRGKCLYIFELLWKMKPQDLSEDSMYKLISSGIASNNHYAKTDRVVELCEVLEKHKTQMPLMEYLDVVNRCAVAYADSYKIECAYDMIKNNVLSLEKIKEIYAQVAYENQMDKEMSSKMILLGRSYSALGCYATMLGKYDEAYKMFENALNEFEISPDNRKITMSHILHYSVEIKDKDLFKKYAAEYLEGKFDTIDGVKVVYDRYVKEICENVSSNTGMCISIMYKMHALVKGIYSFYMEEMNSGFAEDIYNFICNEDIVKLGEHPLQLVYKYNGMILDAYYKNKACPNEYLEKVNDAFMKSLTCIGDGVIDMRKPLNIFMLITYQTMATYNILTSQEKENEELLECMMDHVNMDESKWVELRKKINSIKTDEIRDLVSILCFEYN